MERLDLRLVEYFVVVAEELHFSRAAARLHIAQPTLSQQIRRLEELVGVRLLERTSRHVELTAAGETLLLEGRLLLQRSRVVTQAVRTAGSEQLTVGFYGSAATALLPDALAVFADRYPRVQVSVRELLLGDVDDIVSGNVDVAFTRLHPGQAEIEIEIVAREQRLVALPASHPMAARKSLAFADLREERFITNPATPTTGPPARWLAEQYSHGLSGKIASEASSIQEILILVAAERGVCLLPAPVAKQFPREQVSYVEVEDAEPAVVSLAWRHQRPASNVVAFIETVRHLQAERALEPALGG